MRVARLALPAALLGIVVLAVYLLTGSSDLRHNGDTDLRYQTTQAIVDSHQIWIAHPLSVDTRVAIGRGGHLYAFYAPGQAVLMIPLYVAGKAIAHHLHLPYDVTTLYTSRSLDLFLGAFLAVVFFLACRALGYGVGTSTLLSLIFALASPAWPDAQSALEQTQVDLFLLIAVLAAWTFVRSGNRSWLALSAGALGFAVFTRYDAAIYVPLLAVYLLLARRREGGRVLRRDFVVAAAALLPWLLMVAAWNVVRFGSPFLTGLHEATFGEPFVAGFFGLTLSPGKGLIWYVPEMLLLPWAVPRFYRHWPDLTLLYGALVGLPLLFYSVILYWHGDPAWGPRYLYTALPYLLLPLGTLLEDWRQRASAVKLAFAGLTLLSLGLQISAVSVTEWRYWYRLEALQETSGNPFRWGARFYHYYWTPSQSPLLLQPLQVVQVLRLDALGEQKYLLRARPTLCTPGRCLSNPADNYPVNTLAFWWADTRHPLLGVHTRYAIAAGLGAAGGVAGLALWAVVARDGRRRRVLEVTRAPTFVG